MHKNTINTNQLQCASNVCGHHSATFRLLGQLGVSLAWLCASLPAVEADPGAQGTGTAGAASVLNVVPGSRSAGPLLAYESFSGSGPGHALHGVGFATSGTWSELNASLGGGVSNAATVARSFLARMTLEEKVSLCAGVSTFSINAIPRVGINEEFNLSDGPHNVRAEFSRMSWDSAGLNEDFSTSLPPLSALAATWDCRLAARFGQVLGQEARDRNKDMLLGPGMNMMRTPLCGRNYEYLGEDPKLAGAMAVAVIRAIQENDVAACAKHFALNNQELNRHGVNAAVDERTLREIYLPAFEAAVREAGVLTVMSGYNKCRGVYCSHNDELNNRILKGEWGFRGFVVSDWGGLADTLEGARGGTDLEMTEGKAIRFFRQPLLDAVRNGALPETLIDDKAFRILYVMATIHKIGGQPRKAGSRNTPQHQETARAVAESAIVLLKNDRGILPLHAEKLKTVLVFGDNAFNKHCHLGYSAEGKPPYEITPLEGLKKRIGDTVEIVSQPMPGPGSAEQIPAACLLTEDTQVRNAGMKITAWHADYFDNPELKGAPVFTGFDRQLDFDWKKQPLPTGIGLRDFSVRWTAKVKAPERGTYFLSITCDDGARVFLDGQQVIDGWGEGATRTFLAQTPLEKDRVYDIRVEYFQRGGAATLNFGWTIPSKQGAKMEATLARAKAKNPTAILIFTGNEHGHGPAKENEGADRPDLRLPSGHNEAIARLLSAFPEAVVINLSGAPVEMPWIKDAHAVVQYWFSGMEGGHALASVLMGDVNPSGKLPCTFPAKLADSPAHAMGNYNPTNVHYAEGILIGYRWFDAKGIAPLFPFGHGLSYTRFAIGPPELSATTLRPSDTLTVTVNVRNIGRVAGAEVVQLYVADPKSSVPRPPKELKAFAKIFLQPGETTNAIMKLTARDFSFWDVNTHNWKTEPGTFEIMVGNSSRNITGKKSFTFKKIK